MFDSMAPRDSRVGSVAVDYRFDHPLFAHIAGPYRFVSDLDLSGKVRAVTIVALRSRFVLVAEIQYQCFVLVLGCGCLD